MKHTALLTFGLGLVTALAFGWIAFPKALYRQIDQPMQFSHKTHTGETVGMACEDCHSFDENGRFAGVPGIETCIPCHSEMTGTSPQEKILVEQYVAKNREVPWLVYSQQPENVFFSHASHVKLAGIKCERCHGPHGSTASLRPYQQNRLSTYSRDIWGQSIARVRTAEWDGMKMTDCSGCHHERGVEESCLTCHK